MLRRVLQLVVRGAQLGITAQAIAKDKKESEARAPGH